MGNKVWARPCSFCVSREGFFLASSSRLVGTRNPWHFLVCRLITSISVSIVMWHFPYVCLYVSLFSLLIRVTVIRLGHILICCDLILI